MKTNRFRLLTALLAFVMLFALSINVYAAKSNSVTKDGLTAQLFTDKDSYKSGESVNATVRVDNHAGKEVFIMTSVNVPTGVTLANESAVHDAVIQDGETWTTPNGTFAGTAVANGSTTATGDNMQAGFWVILTALAVCGIIALFVYGKNRTTWLSMMLCLAMVGGMVTAAIPVQAAGTSGSMEVSCTIQVDGKDEEVSATIEYLIYDESDDQAKEQEENTEASKESSDASEESSEPNEDEDDPSSDASEESSAPNEDEDDPSSDASEESSAPSEDEDEPSSDAGEESSQPSEEETGLKKYNTTKGNAVIEAEDVVVSGQELIVVLDDENASGGKAAEAKKYIKQYYDDGYAPANADPAMGFEIIPDQDGTYYIWARAYRNTTGTGSAKNIFMSLDEEQYSAKTISTTVNKLQEYMWVRIATISAESGDSVTVRFTPRQVLLRFDKFIVTMNSTYKPTGTGDDLPAGDEVYVQKMPEDLYAIPTIKPTKDEHPRVMFKESDLNTIRDYMTYDENRSAVTAFNRLKAQSFDGILPTGSANYSGEKLAIIEAKAFDYALNRNSTDETVKQTALANGQQALTAIKNYIATSNFEGISTYSRSIGHVMFTAAEVYDWCYDLLTEDDKKEIVAGCQRIAADMEIGFPPTVTGGQGGIVGHGTEAQLMRDWMSLAIAAYDEYPDIYNCVAGRYFEEFVPAKNHWFTSETQHQGDAYGPYRYSWDLWGQWLIYRMSGEKVYIDDASQVAYQWIYTRRPDGSLMRDGDDMAAETFGVGVYWTSTARMFFYAANFYKDPVLKLECLRENTNLSSFTYSDLTLTPVQVLAFNDPTIGKEDTTSLPLTKYFDSPYGAMVARTGWNMGMNSSDVLAYFKISELWAANHQHLDAGTFQIYYKGILASETGQYQLYHYDHHKNYTKSSIAHNTLAITSQANTNGAQIVPTKNGVPHWTPNDKEEWLEDDLYKTGEVTGYEYGPNIYTPKYSYLAGDIAYAYDDNVEEAVRSMIFLPLEDEEHPAAFVVFDQIKTKEAGSKKTFMLHTECEPTIDAANKVSVIKNTENGYNGMLTNQTLLPVNASLTTIGGEGNEFYVEAGYNVIGQTLTESKNWPLTKPTAGIGKSAEYGWGRIEISTTTEEANQTDYFLNVMYVGDADGSDSNTVEKAELIYGTVGSTANAMIGAKIFDRVAMFHAEKERTQETISFEIPEDTDVANYQVNVAGLKEGTWTIEVNGNTVGSQVASVDGGIIYFSASAGTCKLTYTSSDSNKEFDETTDTSGGSSISVMVDGTYLSKNGEAKENVVFVPMKALYEAIGSEVAWDETAKTATASYMQYNVELNLSNNTATVNDQAVTLDANPYEKDGEIFVPISFVQSAIGESGTITYDATTLLVAVKMIAQKAPALNTDIENAIQVSTIIQCDGTLDTNPMSNSLDGILTTNWAFKDTGNGAWGIYDLGKVYSLEEIQIARYLGDKREYIFDIEVSTDGVNYTKIYDRKHSGGEHTGLESFDMNDVEARYVRYTGYGHIVLATNNPGELNSVMEIVFIENVETPDPSPSPSPDPGPGTEPTPDPDPTPTVPPVTYTITFKDGETVLSTATYAKDAAITIPENPTKAYDADTKIYYEFAGWTPTVATTATADATYTAQWTEVQGYTITFMDDETEISAVPYKKDAAITLPTDPANKMDTTSGTTYAFAGWSPIVSATATADATYTAKWMKSFAISNGTATIEAEDVVVIDGHWLTPGSDKNSRQTASLPNTDEYKGLTTIPSTNPAPSMGFEVVPDADATYYVYARVYRYGTNESGSNRINMSLGSNGYSKKTFTASGGVALNTYTWVKLGTVTGKKDEGVSVRFIVDKAGVRFDKFIVTTDANTPTD